MRPVDVDLLKQKPYTDSLVSTRAIQKQSHKHHNLGQVELDVQMKQTGRTYFIEMLKIKNYK